MRNQKVCFTGNVSQGRLRPVIALEPAQAGRTEIDAMEEPLKLGSLVTLGGGLGERWVVQHRAIAKHGWWYTFRCLDDSRTAEGYFEPGAGSGRVIAEPADST